jgi:hypothetical protein
MIALSFIKVFNNLSKYVHIQEENIHQEKEN